MYWSIKVLKEPFFKGPLSLSSSNIIIVSRKCLVWTCLATWFSWKASQGFPYAASRVYQHFGRTWKHKTVSLDILESIYWSSTGIICLSPFQSDFTSLSAFLIRFWSKAFKLNIWK